MLNRIKSKFVKLSRKEKIGVCIGSFFTLALVAMIPVYAWFSYQKHLGDMQYVDSPTELYITAGHGDDLKYLDLSGIQVTDESTDHAYYVFGVSGSDASGYNLQLAYTTNNQFEYFIYPAKELSPEEVAANESWLVDYQARNEDGTISQTYFYAIDTENIVQTADDYSPAEQYRIITGSKIRGQTSPSSVDTMFLNKKNNEIAANDTKHKDTYSYDRSKVQDYAEPIYWQAHNIKSDMQPDKQIMDYYILEVNWSKTRAEAIARGEQGLKNDRETDIVYISVEATTVQ